LRKVPALWRAEESLLGCRSANPGTEWVFPELLIYFAKSGFEVPRYEEAIALSAIQHEGGCGQARRPKLSEGEVPARPAAL
jgi:hypothetical protein